MITLLGGMATTVIMDVTLKMIVRDYFDSCCCSGKMMKGMVTIKYGNA